MSRTDKREDLRLGNDQIALIFSSRGQLYAIGNDKGRFTLEPKAPAGQRSTLWQVILRGSDGHTVVVEPASDPVVTDLSPDRSCLRLVWRQATEGVPIQVTVTVSTAPDSALSLWRCSIDYTGPLAIWEVTCPRLSGLGRIRDQGDQLAIPWQYGGLIPDPLGCIAEGGSRAYGVSMDYGFYDAEEAVGERASKIAYSYPGMWSLQFMAFYNPEAMGLYFAAHDPQARYKRFGLYGDPGSPRADLVMQHYPDERIDPGLGYSTPYDTVVGLFQGEWWEASALYRQWALQQEWCQKGPLRDRQDIPKWALDTDIWYWNWRPKERLGNHGRVPDLVPAIVDLKRRLQANMSFHWYEWDDRGFNGEMPEIFPLEQGAAAELADGLATLHANDIHAIPYINGRLWTTNHPEWEHKGAKLACRTPVGEVAWYDNHEGTAQICPYTKAWQEVMLSVCEEIVGSYGLDGAYIDQITSCYAVPCFSDQHDHPRGGGDSWYRGYREMMTRIQERVKQRNPDAAFTSESTIDCYLDLFDSNLAREASELSIAHGDQWMPIPLFHSIYHDFAVTYGSTRRLVEPYPQAYYLGEALVLTGGQQLMVEDYMTWDVGTDHYAAYLEYLGKLVAVHKCARQYLTLGRWMPPPVAEVDLVDVRWSEEHPPKQGVPAVLTSAWLLDGALCLVFVNHTEEDRALTYEVDLASYGLAQERPSLYLMNASGLEPLAAIEGGKLRREEQIQGRSAAVYLIR